MAFMISDAPFPRVAPPPPPPPPPPPRKQVHPAVRQPALHQGKPDAAPPERYVQHEVERGENLTEISRRYQTTVPMLEAANPQIKQADVIEIGQKINVPIGADYGREPTRKVVEPGQTLTDLARQHPDVSPQDIARANRHEIPNADRIHVGQEVWVPADRPATALEQKVKATDDAVAGVDRAQQAYNELPAGTNRAIRDEVHQGIQHAKDHLKTATQAELDLRVKASLPAGAPPTEADHASAGQQITERYQADPGATKKLDTALDGLKADRYRASPEGQAEAIVNQARHAGDAPQQMQALNNSLKTAKSEVREAVLNSAGGQQLTQDAARWATDPLAGGDVQKADDKARQEFNGAGPQVPGGTAMKRLEQLTRDLDPALAARLTSEAMPTVGQYVSNYQGQFGSQPLGPTGMANMLKVLDRGADTPAGKANIDSMAQRGLYDRDALRLHVSGGGSPAYAVALSQQPGIDSAGVLQQAYHGVAAYRTQITETARAYSGHMEELGWLVQNHGGSMTPQQLQKAIADYTQDKGPGWEAQGKDYQKQLATQGQTLQNQLTALAQLPPGTPGREDALVGAYNDPAVALALNTAWTQKPELLDGKSGDNLLAMLADPTVRGYAKLTDNGRKLIAQAGTTFVQSQIKQFKNIDPGDAASMARMNQAVARLESPAFAKYLGVKPEDLKNAVGELRKLAPQPGDTLETVQKRLQGYNDFLQSDKGLGKNIGLQLRDPKTGNFGLYEGKEGLKAFDKSTLAGQLLRGAGVALAGVGLASSTAVAWGDRSPDRIAKVLVDAAGLANKVTEFRIGTGALADEGAAKLIGGKVAGRVLGVVGSTFDFIAAGRAYADGDGVKGTLYAAGGVGGVMTALAAGGVWGGPVAWAGIALIGLSAAGLMAWDYHKQVSKHEFDNDHGVSTRFLQHAGQDASGHGGLSEAAARALNDQSGEGYSVMPMLNRYAELKGIRLDDLAQQRRFVDWLNQLSPSQLASMRDSMHHTLDKHDGDVSKIESTQPGDATWAPTTTTVVTMRGPIIIHHYPESVAQIDALLRSLHAPVL
ncbi:LysM peptidoglycan-binding domain-containing protein [Ottowia testudinis]|uniref:LysM peptidoglycan-binding domain-containing protein n=1 Tax=Ottowia testudinis TaxID=2816950 RepID=A0A975H4X8_9BURK|nr:LysM peptidoglycan-binding domain-containing protein [Ottowia testudinis]QTD46845.1 LysM peptidoglycan-binding domain-containing protein [Ottowia testudinis]